MIVMCAKGSVGTTSGGVLPYRWARDCPIVREGGMTPMAY